MIEFGVGPLHLINICIELVEWNIVHRLAMFSLVNICTI